MLSGSSGKGTSAFVTRMRECSFLSFTPHRNFKSVYMTKAIIKKKEISGIFAHTFSRLYTIVNIPI